MIQNIHGIICFRDVILIVSNGSLSERTSIVESVLAKVIKKNFALKLTKCEFSVEKNHGYFLILMLNFTNQNV